jgi:V/A-type H+-transporting ATPase subunit I
VAQVADAGVLEIEPLTTAADAPAGEATRRLQRSGVRPARPAVLRTAPDLDELERTGRVDLLDGEAQLEERCAEAVIRGSVAALAGWVPEGDIASLAHRLAPLGAAVVPLPRPRGAQPPTLLRRSRTESAFGPLVETYATVPYDDVDPTVFAGLAYIVMFAMMFGDVGHGLLLVVVGLVLRTGRPRRFTGVRRAWPFVVGAGAASSLAGLAYGEFFGPTGLAQWQVINPLDEPVRLMLIGVALGALLLAVAYGIGTVNRVREGGWAYALYAPSGLAGVTLFLGGGLVAAGSYAGIAGLLLGGSVVAATGLGLSFVGLRAASGPGAAGLVQAVVELFDVVVRLGSNMVSFARLAAFGLTHAALAGLVWQGTTSLWSRGGAGLLAAVAVFAIGNALAFALETLMAGIQALRLEYYELFSRVFQDEGRPFAPWHLPALEPHLAEEVAT